MVANDNDLKFTKTDERIQFGKREAVIYIGQRGAKYIKNKGEYVNIRNLHGGRPRSITHTTIPAHITDNTQPLLPPKSGINWLGYLEQKYPDDNRPEITLLHELIEEWYEKNKTPESKKASIEAGIYPIKIFNKTDGYVWKLKLHSYRDGNGKYWALYCEAVDGSLRSKQIATEYYDRTRK